MAVYVAFEKRVRIMAAFAPFGGSPKLETETPLGYIEVHEKGDRALPTTEWPIIVQVSEGFFRQFYFVKLEKLTDDVVDRILASGPLGPEVL